MKYKLIPSEEVNRSRSKEDYIPEGQSIIWDEKGFYVCTCMEGQGEIVLAALNKSVGKVGM